MAEQIRGASAWQSAAMQTRAPAARARCVAQARSTTTNNNQLQLPANATLWVGPTPAAILSARPASPVRVKPECLLAKRPEYLLANRVVSRAVQLAAACAPQHAEVASSVRSRPAIGPKACPSSLFRRG